MALDLLLRDYADRVRNGSMRQILWAEQTQRALRSTLGTGNFAAVAGHVRTEKAHLSRNIDNPSNLDDLRRDAAIAWLLSAQRAAPDDGVSLGYFPLEAPSAWRPSYPETTGYIISTLVRCARFLNRPELLSAAIAMGDWEIAVQMDNGAVQGGPVVAREKQTAAAFNTGMVLDGWCTLVEATGETRFSEAARRAARFLRDDVDENGYFRTNGAFVTGSRVKTYTCLCASAMWRFAQIVDERDIGIAAIRVVEGALRKQAPNGWYADDCLTRVGVPLTHTIGYTVQGIAEVGIMAGREDFVVAARHATVAALSAQRVRGFLPGRLDKNWRGAANYVCLTGSAQLAAVGFQLAGMVGDANLKNLARSALAFVKATQRLSGDDPAMVGGIAGSFPFLGGYMTAGFPNWATKYFIDALLAETGEFAVPSRS